MPQVSTGCDPVAEKLFEFLYLRKPTLDGARPHYVILNANLKDPSRTRYEGQFPDIVLKRAQQLLCHPGGPKQPTALSAVFNFDSRRFARHLIAV